MPFPADLAEPVTVGGILFPAVSEGILFPPDPAGMPFPADLAKLNFVSEGMLLPTDPGKLLSPADHVELCAVGVTDLDELSELGTFAGKSEDEARSPPCCYVDDGIDFWDPVMMAKEFGCRVDELPVYYGGDLWNPDGSDIGYSDYYDQSELSDYEDPRDFFRDEWLGSCEHAPDGSYFDIPEVGKASSPVSGYSPGIDMEVSVTPVRLQQDSGDAYVSAVEVTSGSYFLDPPCCRDLAELRTPVCQTYCEPVKELQLGVWRISDVREYPGVSYESSSTVVACMMVTDMEAPKTVVLKTDKGARFEGMCLWGINCTGTFVRMPDVVGPKVCGIVCERKILWDPGGVGARQLAVCDDYFWLMILIRCMLTYSPRRSRLPYMFLNYVCSERTIVGEVMSAASVILPYGRACSPCLHVSRIKRWLTDVVIGRVITALHAAVLGIITPGGDTIQAVCPLLLGSVFMGHLMWLPQVSRWEWLWCYITDVHRYTVTSSCRLGIVVGSNSLVIEQPTGPLCLAAHVRRLAAEFRLCGLLECFWIVVCRTFWVNRHWRVTWVMAAGKETPVGAHSGVTFDVKIDIPWNAPEAHIQLDSAACLT